MFNEDILSAIFNDIRIQEYPIKEQFEIVNVVEDAVEKKIKENKYEYVSELLSKSYV